MPEPIPFIDLQAQRARIAAEIDAAIARVMAHGQFIMGPEVAALEAELAATGGVDHAIACSSGTDALLLALYALEIGPGDAVFVPAFTFAATAEVVALAGATPVFVDVDGEDFNISADSLARGIAAVEADGTLRPAAVIAVDLFGQPADHNAIADVARGHGLKIVADCAQSFGARYRDTAATAFGDIAATSFFPAKPLGCYGDGGAVFTGNAELADVVRCLRVHGEGESRYDNVRIGINGRMDTLQAAILLEKLKIFEDEVARRNRIAGRYDDALLDVVATPRLRQDRTSVWAQYTVLTDRRDHIRSRLQQAGIPTGVYYPCPLNRQPAYRHFPVADGGVPISEDLANRVLSLPMHPYLETDVQDRIVEEVRAACR